MLSGELPLSALPTLSDDEVEAAITSVRGFGRWSAHMYMMFALGRPDIWPSGDLAVRVGFGRIMGWADRPDEKMVIAEGDVFSPIAVRWRCCAGVFTARLRCELYRMGSALHGAGAGGSAAGRRSRRSAGGCSADKGQCILAYGGNAQIELQDATAHAEIRMLREAGVRER